MNYGANEMDDCIRDLIYIQLQEVAPSRVRQWIERSKTAFVTG